jgi:acyl-CoA hydrolase
MQPNIATNPELQKVLRELPDSCVFVSTSCCSTPSSILKELFKLDKRGKEWTLYLGMLLGSSEYVDEIGPGQLKLKTWHASTPIQKMLNTGDAQYVPLRAKDLPNFLSSIVDVALIRISKPDSTGICSLGPSTSWTKAVMKKAKFIIAEVDESLPWTEGDSKIDISQIGFILASETEVPTYDKLKTETNEKIIANHVLSLIPENPTLQFGIGSISESITQSLDATSLGHKTFVGMGSDGMMKLLDGQARNSKSRQVSLFAVELLGSRELMKFADHNPLIEMVDSRKCHDPTWLGSFPRLISINSALAVDLKGQVASESIGGRFVSGIGGSVDFFDGAHQSLGGIRIIAMNSTSINQNRSKIVSHFDPETPVSIPRYMVDYIVTEFGIAHLTNKTASERTEALITISAPEFRDTLANSLSRG